MAVMECLLVVCSVFVAWLMIASACAKRRRLPPGPWGLPIVGYLPWIDPTAPHESLASLAKRYGPVCGLRMGSLYTVLLADPRLVRQALAKDVFAGRAPLHVTHGIMQGYGLIGADGVRWQEQRRFVVGCLRNLGMVRTGAKRDRAEMIINSMIDESLTTLARRSGDGIGVDPHSTLYHCMGNVMNSLVFGITYDEENDTWRWLRRTQEDGAKRIGITGLLNFLPFLRHLSSYRAMMNLLVEGKIKTHGIYKEIATAWEDAEEPEGESVLAAYILETRRRLARGDPGHFTDVQMYHVLADLFGAGVDTTLATLRWFLLLLAVHPCEQEKIYREMRVVPSGRRLELNDRTTLPYLEAAIAEAQRLRSVTPVGIPHGAIEEAEIGGFVVPKGTMIIPLQWAIHMNPEFWRDPEEYQPFRFIDDDGRFVKPEAFLPFQTGRRICVGEELAKMLLFLFAGRILRKFFVSLPQGTPADLHGECGIILAPKPHKLIFTPRS